jgi:hypothetical protein
MTRAENCSSANVLSNLAVAAEVVAVGVHSAVLVAAAPAVVV